MFNLLLQSSISAGLIVDIVCVVILALSAFISMAKGFMSQVLKLLGTLVALILAFMLCEQVANFIDGAIGIKYWMAKTFFAGKFDNLTDVATADNISKAISNLGLPEFAVTYLTKLIGEASGTIGEFIVSSLTTLILKVIVFIILFIIAKLLFRIVKKILSFITSLPLIRTVDKLLGFVYGAIVGFFILYLLVFIIDIFPSVDFILIVRNAMAESVVATFLKQENILVELVTWGLSYLAI